MLDDPRIVSHDQRVETQAEFLERLLAIGATQSEIGAAIGVAQSNANTLFRPGKNGKLRYLKMDEAVKLAEKFGLSEAPPKLPDQFQVHPETIEPILDALLLAAPPPGRVSDQSRRALSVMLAYALEQLGDQLSSPANPGAGKVAARAALSRFREQGLA